MFNLKFYISKKTKNFAVKISLLIFLLVCVGVLNLDFQCQSYKSPLLYDNSNLKLWYKQPAQKWTEALPVGNGRLGAMVFGKVYCERIQLNEESLWAGSPVNNNNPEALKNLRAIQELLLQERNKEAHELVSKTFIGTPPRIRSYQTLGDILLTSDSTSVIKNYRRELFLESGLCRITYVCEGVQYSREIFVSAPDNIIVIRLTADKSGALNTSVQLVRDKDAQVRSEGSNRLVMNGQIIDEPDPLRGPDGPHMKFAARIVALNDGGSVHAIGDTLKVTGANALTLLLTAATDYCLEKLNFDRSINPVNICKKILARAEKKSFEKLKKNHIEENRSLFSRMQIELGKSPLSNLPTDDRLKAVQEGKKDPGLIALYFQYGRYLLMGSSRRPGMLPANLQGIWNEHFKAPWNSDFHTNINLQMNYWPAEVCNLHETVMPLTDFLSILRTPGRVTAKEMYDAGGWTLHHLTNPFGRTGVADGPWGVTPLNGPWMTFPLWRHYEFTGDQAYLREKAYPVMKESAQFVLDFLIEDKEGRLITAPSHSPENRFILPGTGERFTLTYAATTDIQIIKALFSNCIATGEIQNVDSEFRDKLKAALQKLPSIKIGNDGTIQEWIKDYEEAEPGHRHMSHLLGLYPLAQITPRTPELFQAAKNTIQKRLQHGGGHTGWSRAWIINFFARLLDGEKAYENVLELLRKSTLPNLFDNHPPFQIDGNFGGAAGIAEMLLQSHGGEIVLLPALPEAWQEGNIKGLCARGGFETDMIWKGGVLSEIKIYSKQGNPCLIRYKDRIIKIETKKGKTYTLSGELK